MRNWLIYCLSMILIGCSARIEYIEKPTIDYPLPDPVPIRNVKWHVLTKETMSKKADDAVFVGLTWSDQLEHRKWLEDIKVYIQKQQIIICKHQQCEVIDNGKVQDK